MQGWGAVRLARMKRCCLADIVRFLLDNGADIQAEDEDGMSFGKETSVAPEALNSELQAALRRVWILVSGCLLCLGQH